MRIDGKIRCLQMLQEESSAPHQKCAKVHRKSASVGILETDIANQASDFDSLGTHTKLIIRL